MFWPKAQKWREADMIFQHLGLTMLLVSAAALICQLCLKNWGKLL